MLTETSGQQPEEDLEVPGAQAVMQYRLKDGQWQAGPAPVPSELALTIYVNKHEVATVLCTPHKLNSLVAGFLYQEGIIKSVSEIANMRVCIDDALADVTLSRQDFTPSTRRVLTSGCGGGAGTTLGAEGIPPITSSLNVTTDQVSSLMKELQTRAELYRVSGGVHVAALGDGAKMLDMAEDVGRHNSIDKILGDCLFLKMQFKDRLLATTGRLSSEMVLKAAKMGVPIVISHSSATSRAIALGEQVGVTLVGYVRGGRLTVYTHPERIQGCPATKH